MKKFENRLLVLLSNIKMTNEEKDEIKSLLTNQKINWKYIIDVSINQGINGIMYYNLISIKQYIPRYIFLQFTFFNKEIRKIEESQYEEYYRIHNLFLNHGIIPVALKGFTFSKYFYKLEGSRVSRDLDILIPSEKITLAGDLLKKNGYIEINNVGSPKCDVKGTIKGKINKNSLYLSSAHGFSKFINTKNNFYIELHHTSYYFGGLNLLYLYNNKVRQKDEIYTLNEVDMFIFACAHFWQHFRGKMDTAALTLRCISDVRSLYFLLETKNKIEELLVISKKYKVFELLCCVITAVKKVIDGNYDDRLLSEKLIGIYRNDYFELDTLKLDYLFDKKILSDKIYELYCKVPNIKKKNVISIEYIDNLSLMDLHDDTLSNYQFFSSNHTNKMLFFTSHISSLFSLKYEETSIAFKFNWDKKYLYLSVKYFGNHKYSLDKDKLDFASSYIKIKLFEKEKIRLYYIQPNIHGTANVFLLESDNNEILCSSSQTIAVVSEKWFHFTTAIPWEELNYNPKEGNKIRFDVAGVFFGSDFLCNQYEMNFAEGNGYCGSYGFSNKYITLKGY